MLRVVALAVLLLHSAQDPKQPHQLLRGFWTVVTKVCPPTGERCMRGDIGSWGTDVAIDVRGDLVLIEAGPNRSHPLGTAHADTLQIDGNVMTWITGGRGFTRRTAAPIPGDHYTLGSPGSRVPWPGESWVASADGRTLVHGYKWTNHGKAFRLAWTYRRSSGQ